MVSLALPRSMANDSEKNFRLNFYIYVFYNIL